MATRSTRAQRIVLVSPPPWRAGGVERYVRETAGRFNRIGADFDVDLFVVGEAPPVDFEKSWPGRIRTYAPGTAGLPPRAFLRDVVAAARDARLLHVQSVSRYESSVALLCPRGTPLVVSPHYHPRGSTAALRALRPLWDDVVAKRILLDADLVTHVSQIERGDLLERFPELRENILHSLPNGVDREAAAQARRMSTPHRWIVHVGRLVAYKNVHLLVDALAHLDDEWRLAILGDGPAISDILARAAAQGVEGRVVLRAGVPDAEKFAWLKTADIAGNLSSVEAFGISVLEALAAGTPVVVNDRGGLSELARRFPGGVLAVDAEGLNVAELASCLSKWAGARADEDLSAFDWNDLAGDLAALYSSVG